MLSGSNLSRDPLIRVYGSLRSASVPGAPASLASRSFLEVAEFFGPEWTQAIDPADGSPRRALHFDAASHFSRLYTATGSSPPIWENPVVAPSGAQYPYFLLDQPGRGILDSVLATSATMPAMKIPMRSELSSDSVSKRLER